MRWLESSRNLNKRLQHYIPLYQYTNVRSKPLVLFSVICVSYLFVVFFRPYLQNQNIQAHDVWYNLVDIISYTVLTGFSATCTLSMIYVPWATVRKGYWIKDEDKQCLNNDKQYIMMYIVQKWLLGAFIHCDNISLK